MRIEEVKELINDVSRCQLKRSETGDMFIPVPNPNVYDAEAEGYKLYIKKSIVNESSCDCIKSIVEKRKLKMKESKEHWIIYTPRKA